MRVESIPARIARFENLCRRQGLALTHQRRTLYRILAESQDHPTPEDVFQRARHEIPSISLGTVYKNLTTLRELGLVAEVPSASGPARFDANLDRHHHLVCTQCGEVVDFYDDDLDEVRIEPQGLGGFTPQTVQIQVSGICARCRDASMELNP
jgi:Fur family peroxide stress response transcriptional regulator